jgi:hypothetical protein
MNNSVKLIILLIIDFKLITFYVNLDKLELYVNLAIIMEIFFGQKDFQVQLKDV